MSDRRSIQDIIPPARSKPIRQRKEKEEIETEAPQQNGSPKLPLKPRKREGTSMVGLFGIALGVIIVVGIAFGVVSTFFHRADVTITAYAFQVTIADTFDAAPNGQTLSYNTVTFETTLSKEVPSTSSQYSEDRASGTITIFNEYSTQSQRLITNTRFETGDGLIYRVKSPVTVPGYSTSGGSKVPGSIEVTVYADDPGERYNIPAGSFTIPGLAGSPQFDSMYARSNEAMVGGFVGERAVVDESVRDAAALELKSELDRAAREGLRNRLSSEQFIIEDTLAVAFVDQPDKATNSGAEVSVKAIASAPAFNETQIAALIAQEGGVVFEAPLTIPNRDQLTIQIDKTSDDEEVLGFVISGDAQLVARVDTEQFVRDIQGKDQGSVGSILTRYPGIKDLSLSVYPFWRQSLPGESDRFTVSFDE